MKIIRSKRKTFALQIKPHEGLIVRVPYRATKEQIEKFIVDNQPWIEKHLKAMEEWQEKQGFLVSERLIEIGSC